MIRALLIGNIAWTDDHPVLMLACAALCCHLALWVQS